MDLKDYLKREGITQETLAAYLEVSLIHMNGVINKRTETSKKLAKKIEKYTDGHVSRLEILYPFEKF